MGSFFSTIHINNNNQIDFLVEFEKYMEQKGFVKCSPEDAELTYALLFSPSWVTIVSESYMNSSQKYRIDARNFANDMKTCSFTVSVVDSDFAILELFDNSLISCDTMIVGDGSSYGYNDSLTVNRECWSKLIKSENSWNELFDLTKNNDVSIWILLQKLSDLFGIIPKYMTYDYNEIISSNSDDNIMLSFKKKANNKTNMNSAFKEVFGKDLDKLGFKLIKGKHPYFVRVINREILHIITYCNDKESNENYKVFDVQCGIATIYRQRITFNQVPQRMNWLTSNFWIYANTNKWNDDTESKFRKFHDSIYRFTCNAKTTSLEAEMERALDVTKQIMLPLLDKITTLESCIEYRYLTGMNMSLYYATPDFDFGNKINGNESNEGMLYFKVSPDICRNNLDPNESEAVRRGRENFEKIISDSILLSQTFEELELRKEYNMKILQTYQLI